MHVTTNYWSHGLKFKAAANDGINYCCRCDVFIVSELSERSK